MYLLKGPIKTSISRDMGSAAEGQDSRAPNKYLQNIRNRQKTIMPGGRIVDRQAYIKIPRKCVEFAKNGNNLGDLEFDLVVDRGS